MQVTKRRTILIADPGSYWTRVLTNYLNKDNYQMLLVADGLRALQIIDSQPVDLLVCELELPEITGSHLIKMIRSRSDGQNLPIVVYTSEPREKWDWSGIDLCQSILVKYETEAEELAGIIEKILN